jgi:DNA-binding Lrp family transcriptional regulator
LARKNGESASVRQKLDRLDLDLLALLQLDNLQTADRLSEKVGRSSSAVARRLRRLRESGAIASDVALVSEQAAGPAAVGDRSHPARAPRAAGRRPPAPRLVASPNVQLCLDLAGSFDILLLVVARDMHAYNEFADAALEDNPAVRRFETTFVKRRVKATLAFPLGGSPES